MRFESNFREFLNTELRLKAESCLELDKSFGLTYMEEHKYRFKEIFSSIPCLSNSVSILDIGTTPFTFFIKQMYPHYNLASINLSNHMEERCKAKGIIFKRCDLNREALPFEDERFDIVILTEVLEHLIISPLKLMKQISRVMRGGGLLVFSVPNFASLTNRVRFLFGYNPLKLANEQMVEPVENGYVHVRGYTLRECVALLKRCDFIIKKKELLSPPILSAFKMPNKYKVQLVARVIYYLVCFMVPSFRWTIYIKALKAIKTVGKAKIEYS